MEIHFQTCQDVMLVQRRAHKLVMLFQNWNPDVNYSKTNTEFIKTTKLVKNSSRNYKDKEVCKVLFDICSLKLNKNCANRHFFCAKQKNPVHDFQKPSSANFAETQLFSKNPVLKMTKLSFSEIF